MSSTRSLTSLCAVLSVCLFAAASPARAADVVDFGLNWVPQAEQGGFLQAKATGIYTKYGLDVNIHVLGPQGNIDLEIASGQLQVGLVSNCFNSLNAVANDIPLLEIAAFFQKEPRVLIAHPNRGNDSLEALRGKPIMLAKSGVQTFWNFLKARYGYTDDQVRVYNSNVGPFLADPDAIQQGMLTSEPYAIRQAGVEPVVMLLSDYGYQNYSDVIETTQDMVRNKPDVLQRFINASIEGWYSYMYGDPTPGNKAILAANPDMSQGQIDFTISQLKKYGIVDSGDSKTLGIGAMTDARWHSFFDMMSKAGVYKPTLDVSKAYTLQFVDKRVGLATR